MVAATFRYDALGPSGLRARVDGVTTRYRYDGLQAVVRIGRLTGAGHGPSSEDPTSIRRSYVDRWIRTSALLRDDVATVGLVAQTARRRPSVRMSPTAGWMPASLAASPGWETSAGPLYPTRFIDSVPGPSTSRSVAS